MSESWAQWVVVFGSGVTLGMVFRLFLRLAGSMWSWFVAVVRGI